MAPLRRSSRLAKLRDCPVSSSKDEELKLKKTGKSMAMEEQPPGPPESESPPKKRIGRRCLETRRRGFDFYVKKETCIELAEEAISYFNQKNLSAQGLEYELVEAGEYGWIRFPCTFHLNFIAKPKNAAGADESKLFFAQRQYKDSGPCWIVCILGPPDIDTGLQGCTFCKNQHPPDLDFTRSYLIF